MTAGCKYDTLICDECNGEGTIEVLIDCPASFTSGYGDQEEKTIWCEKCNGDGEIAID